MIRARIEHLATERGALTARADDIRELARDYLRLLDRVTGEIVAHDEAVRRGMEAARRRGTHVGRPRVELDMGRVAELWADGYTPRAIARELGYHRSTVRRRLIEAGYDVARREGA